MTQFFEVIDGLLFDPAMTPFMEGMIARFGGAGARAAGEPAEEGVETAGEAMIGLKGNLIGRGRQYQAFEEPSIVNQTFNRSKEVYKRKENSCGADVEVKDLIGSDNSDLIRLCGRATVASISRPRNTALPPQATLPPNQHRQHHQITPTLSSPGLGVESCYVNAEKRINVQGHNKHT